MIIQLAFIIIGFIFLISGAHHLIEGAASIAKQLHISELVIGLTIISIGTSAPELVVNILAAISGNNQITLGNVFGSNIANILLVLGVSGLIAPLTIPKSTVKIEIPFCLFITIILGILLNDHLFKNFTNCLSFVDGVILIILLCVFLYYTYFIARSSGEEKGHDTKVYSLRKSLIFIIIGSIGLALGGKFVVYGAVNIASVLGVSQALIGLSIVALGTSLPELFASAVATYKGKLDMAIGNVVGSNIFNILFILGISSIITTIEYPLFLNSDYLFVIISIFSLFIFMFLGKKHRLTRVEALLFLGTYIVYMIYIIQRG